MDEFIDSLVEYPKTHPRYTKKLKKKQEDLWKIQI